MVRRSLDNARGRHDTALAALSHRNARSPNTPSWSCVSAAAASCASFASLHPIKKPWHCGGQRTTARSYDQCTDYPCPHLHYHTLEKCVQTIHWSDQLQLRNNSRISNPNFSEANRNSVVISHQPPPLPIYFKKSYSLPANDLQPNPRIVLLT